MKTYRVITGKYKGRTGRGEVTNYGTVMFYPDNKVPYRVCLMANMVKADTETPDMEEAREVADV
jgi:hypothetical protein